MHGTPSQSILSPISSLQWLNGTFLYMIEGTFKCTNKINLSHHQIQEYQTFNLAPYNEVNYPLSFSWTEYCAGVAVWPECVSTADLISIEKNRRLKNDCDKAKILLKYVLIVWLKCVLNQFESQERQRKRGSRRRYRHPTFQMQYTPLHNMAHHYKAQQCFVIKNKPKIPPIMDVWNGHVPPTLNLLIDPSLFFNFRCIFSATSSSRSWGHFIFKMILRRSQEKTHFTSNPAIFYRNQPKWRKREKRERRLEEGRSWSDGER